MNIRQVTGNIWRRAFYTTEDREKLVYKGESTELTRSENKILSLLSDHKGKVVERERLMEYLWSTDEYVTDGLSHSAGLQTQSEDPGFCRGIFLHPHKKGTGYYLE